MKAKFTVEKFLMDRIKWDDLTPEMQADTTDLLEKANALMADFYARNTDEKERVITSGYRSPAINAKAGGAVKSKHMICQAIDISDPTGTLDKWLSQFPEKLIEFDLYREHPDHTPGWVHCQIIPPKSKKRTFLP